MADDLGNRIAQLHCPSCKGSLSLDVDLSKPDQNIHHGIVVCGCRAYPLTHNILNLGGKYGISTQYAVDCLKRGDIDAATLGQLEAEILSAGLFRKIIRHAYKRHLLSKSMVCKLRGMLSRDLLTAPDLTAGLRTIKAGTFGTYLHYRFGLASFFAGLPLSMLLMDEPPATVVDIGCGAGHYQYVLNRLYPNAQMLAIDQFYTNLYLGQRYIERNNTLYVSGNLATPPPTEATFDLLMASDVIATLYVDEQLLHKYLDLLKPSGLALGLRIDQHWNKEFRTDDISHWQRVLASVNPHFFDENVLVKSFYESNCAQLTPELTITDLTTSRAFCMIGSQERNIYSLATPDFTQQATPRFSTWALNPAYAEGQVDGEETVFRISSEPFPIHPEEWNGCLRALVPPEVRVPTAAVKGHLIATDYPGLPALLQQRAVTLSSTDFGPAPILS